MANYMQILGRAAGRAFNSPVFDRALTVAAGYVLSEMRLVDVRAKRVMLRRKRSNHLLILGRTVYRLLDNGIEPMADERTVQIIRVLREIDEEICAVEEELERRRRYDAEQRRRSADRSRGGNGSGGTKG